MNEEKHDWMPEPQDLFSKMSGEGKHTHEEINKKLAELIPLLHEHQTKTAQKVKDKLKEQDDSVHIFTSKEVEALLWWAEAVIEVNNADEKRDIGKYDVKLVLELAKVMRGLQALGWLGTQIRKFLLWLVSFIGLIVAIKSGVLGWLKLQLGL